MEKSDLTIAIEAVREVTGVPEELILGRTRPWRVARARHFLVYVLTDVFEMDTATIESLIHRSKGVASHSLHQVANLVSTSMKDRDDLMTIRSLAMRMRECQSDDFETWWLRGGWMQAKVYFRQQWDAEKAATN